MLAYRYYIPTAFIAATLLTVLERCEDSESQKRSVNKRLNLKNYSARPTSSGLRVAKVRNILGKIKK
jgi:hypothetical protein